MYYNYHALMFRPHHFSTEVSKGGEGGATLNNNLIYCWVAGDFPQGSNEFYLNKH